MLYSQVSSKSNIENYSNVFRSPKCINNLISHINAQTLYSAFMFGYKKNSKAKCLGEIKELEPIKYEWLSYSNVLDATNILGTRLIEETYLSNQTISGEFTNSNFIGILTKNSSNALITELTCYFNSYISVPIYESFNLDVIELILSQTKLKIIFVDTKNVYKLLDIKNYYSLQKIVCYEKIDNDIIEKFRLNNIIIIYYGEFCGTVICKEFVKPKPNYVATICYTNEIIGETKGVILTHDNIIASMTGYIYKDIVLNKPDIHINYLPLSNMFEKSLILSVFFGGGCTGFSRGNIDLLLDDIKALKPTILSSVPMIYKHIYDLIMSNLNSDMLTRNLFYYGYKISKYDFNLPNTFLKKTIYKSIRNQLGGDIRIMIIGNGIIESKIVDFMKICFDCIVIQQYGLTETAGCISLSNHYDKLSNNVGGPIVCGEFCIKRLPHFEFSVDKIYTLLKGELLYRGVNLFKGYYTGITKENGDVYQIDTDLHNMHIDNDGWYHTGDYVVILKNGAIRFIDRIDNIVKIGNDNILSYEKIERIIEMVPNIHQSIVYYKNDTSTIVTLVVLKDRLDMPNLETDLLAQINTICRDLGVLKCEIPTHVSIINAPFTIENGLLTPLYKLQRNQIIKKYMTIINKI